MSAASQAKYVRARERNSARIAALNKAAPIMCLPTEVRAAIFGHLSVIQQFKVNYYPELRWVFNTSDEWNIGRVENEGFAAILLLYEEAQLFDKVAAKVALLRIEAMRNKVKRIHMTVFDILGRCNALRYYNSYNEDEYNEKEYEPLLMYVIQDLFRIQDIYDCAIVVKACFILINKKKVEHEKLHPDNSSEECVWTTDNGWYRIETDINNRADVYVGHGWELYHDLVYRIGILSVDRNNWELDDQLLAAYKKYFAIYTNATKAAIISNITVAREWSNYCSTDNAKYRYLLHLERLAVQ